MNLRLRLTVLALTGIPTMAAAADFGVDSTTLFRIEERSVPGFKDETIAPATMFLGLDADRLGDGNLSFHLHGWGRLDLGDDSTRGGSADGDLSYAYLAYRFPTADGQVKVGRHFVYAGVANEQLDGVSARTDLAAGFTLSAFGGAPVRLNMTDDNKGDYVAGGRLGWRLPGYLEIGVSALREGGIDTGPASAIKDYRQLVGGDIWVAPFRMVELRGHSNYNTATDGFAEHSYLLQVTPLRSLALSAEYSDYRLRDYFASTNLRSLFNPDRDETLRSYGGSATWTIAKPVEVSADYKRINYDSPGRGNTNRYGAEARLNFLERKLKTGLSYHRADADRSINSYHEFRGWGLYDVSRFRGSLDAIVHRYDDGIYSEKTAYELIGSLGYRILPALMLSGDLSYGENPRLDSELRGVIRLVWNYISAAKGGSK